MSRTIIIGDIHGCWNELRDLLDRIAPTSADRIMALGDVVDRGPASEQVLEFLRDTPRATSVMGNHEWKHLRAARGTVKPALSQLIVQAELAESYPAWLMFMQTLPRFIELPDALLAHGFYEPRVPLHRQRETVLAGSMSGALHLRRVCPSPWYAHYDGSKPLVVGHHDYLRNGQPLVHAERVYGLDTSCVRGGRLTALVLPEFRIVSVPARRDHWSATRQRHEAHGLRASLPGRTGWHRPGRCARFALPALTA